MGLELVPQGISRWNAGSGTSCSHCHPTGKKKSDVNYQHLYYLPLSASLGISREVLLCPGVSGWCEGDKLRKQRGASHRWLGALWFPAALFLSQIKVAEAQRKRLMTFSVMYPPPVDLSLSGSSSLCCHGDPGRGTQWSGGMKKSQASNL